MHFVKKTPKQKREDFNTKLKYLTLNVGELTYAKNILRDLGKEDQLVVIPNDFL